MRPTVLYPFRSRVLVCAAVMVACAAPGLAANFEFRAAPQKT